MLRATWRDSAVTRTERRGFGAGPGSTGLTHLGIPVRHPPTRTGWRTPRGPLPAPAGPFGPAGLAAVYRCRDPTATALYPLNGTRSHHMVEADLEKARLAAQGATYVPATRPVAMTGTRPKAGATWPAARLEFDGQVVAGPADGAPHRPATVSATGHIDVSTGRCTRRRRRTSAALSCETRSRGSGRWAASAFFTFHAHSAVPRQGLPGPFGRTYPPGYAASRTRRAPIDPRNLTRP